MIRRAFLTFILVAALMPRPAAAQTALRAFAGTWSLVSLEQGDSLQSLARVQFPIGILIQDTNGNFIEIVTTQGRSIARTPEGQVRQFTGFTSGWGAFAASSPTSVTYTVKGHVDPAMQGQRIVRTYELKDKDLTMSEPGSPGHPARKITWRKVQELEAMPAAQEAVIGFWHWDDAGMVSLEGKMLLPTPKRDEGVIVYTPTGHMAVIYLPPPGRKRFAAPIPTAEEARAAMTDLVTYFGVYLAQPRSSAVTHYQLAIPNPAQVGSSLYRNFRVDGNKLKLTFPQAPLRGSGPPVQNTINLSRLGGIKEMWPDR